MIELTADQKDALTITQLIFHVVQHEGDEPILLDETPIKGFEDFFLARVRETLIGNQYEFVPGSDTLNLLKEISAHPEKFVDNSKQLAVNFHAQRSGRIKPGAIILIRLNSGPREFFLILKYDREQVIAYNVVGDTRAVLQEIVNSFTSSKKALQKSAFIELTKDGGELIVIDQTVSYDITEFFRGFLNVKRIKKDDELTNVVYQAALHTARDHRDELPKDLTQSMRSIVFDAIQSVEVFNQEDFFYMVFGASGNTKIFRTFGNYLRKGGIDGDGFRFNKDALKPPRFTKYRTDEGVKIDVPLGAEHTVVIKKGGANEKSTITITTDKYIEE